MRVLSRFHDYYDLAMSAGQDRSCVYLRETDHSATLGLEFERRLQGLIPGVRYAHIRHRDPRKPWSEQVAEAFVVILAGRLYPGMRFFEGRRGAGLDEVDSTFVYSLNDTEAQCAARGIPWDKRSPFSKRTAGEVYAQFFALDGDQRFVANAVDERLPLCLAARPSHDSHLRLVRNPVLRDLAFYRRLDAWQTFQELSMFLGGMLAPESVELSKISDKDRLLQRGFDKRSFRHR